VTKDDDASAESTCWDLTASHGFVGSGSRDAEDGCGLVDREGGPVLMFAEVSHVRMVCLTTHSTTHTC
jgi:hypothetical protein